MAAANKQEAARTALSTLQRRFPSFERLSLLQAALLAVAGKVQLTASLSPQQCNMQSDVDRLLDVLWFVKVCLRYTLVLKQGTASESRM